MLNYTKIGQSIERMKYILLCLGLELFLLKFYSLVKFKANRCLCVAKVHTASKVGTPLPLHSSQRSSPSLACGQSFHQTENLFVSVISSLIPIGHPALSCAMENLEGEIQRQLSDLPGFNSSVKVLNSMPWARDGPRMTV